MSSQLSKVAEEQVRWDERRGSRRVKFVTDIHFSSDSNFYTGFTSNISEGGVFVATYNPFPIGTMMELQLRMPGCKEPITVKGEVRWVQEPNPDSDGHPGVGVRFLDLDDDVRTNIEKFANVRDTIFYDDE